MTPKVIQKFDEMTEEVIKRTEEVFECKCCGKCCKEVQGVSMNNVDVRRLSDCLGISKIEFIDRYMAEFDGRRGRMAVERVCEFRSGDGKCTVYGSRPKVCKEYPCRSLLYKYAVFVAIYDYSQGNEVINPMACIAIRENADVIGSIIIDTYNGVCIKMNKLSLHR